MYKNDRPEELCEAECSIPDHQHDSTVLTDAMLAEGFRRTVQVDGIMYCEAHDDFAIEGYDWSEVCHEQWVRDQQDGPSDECKLVPMFVESTR